MTTPIEFAHFIGKKIAVIETVDDPLNPGVKLEQTVFEQIKDQAGMPVHTILCNHVNVYLLPQDDGSYKIERIEYGH